MLHRARSRRATSGRGRSGARRRSPIPTRIAALVDSPFWTMAFLAISAGAITEVRRLIARGRERYDDSALTATPLGGAAAGAAVVSLTALLGVTPAMEDYLKSVYQLREEAVPVTMQRLAERLGASGPSVTNMVKRLHKRGLVRHARYNGVELTEAGERIALQVMRRHRLLELYLVRTLGYSWDEVHAEAERLEHHISADLEARIDAALGHPIFDPHGDPIPARNGGIADVPALSLLSLEPGETATISRVSDRDPALLRYLGALGLVPGVQVVVLEKLPFDGPLRLGVGAVEHVISPTLAAAVRVTGHGFGGPTVDDSRGGEG